MKLPIANCKHPLQLIFKTFYLISAFSLCHGLTGCSSGKFFQSTQPDYRAQFHAEPDQVWEIVTNLFQDFPKIKMDPQQRFLETDWNEGYSDRAFGLLGGGMIGGQWKKRAKYLVWVTPLAAEGSSARSELTEVRILSRLEERAPGGSQAYRWQRAPSQGKLESEVFNRIHELLKNPSI